MEAIGAINDADYAAVLARHCADLGYGPQRCGKSSMKKASPGSCGTTPLDALPDSTGQIDAFLERKLRGRVPDQREKKRLCDALLRRGFSWGDVKSAWNRYGSEVEED